MRRRTPTDGLRVPNDEDDDDNVLAFTDEQPLIISEVRTRWLRLALFVLVLLLHLAEVMCAWGGVED